MLVRIEGGEGKGNHNTYHSPEDDFRANCSSGTDEKNYEKFSQFSMCLR
jgi:hypothetical protein